MFSKGKGPVSPARVFHALFLLFIAGALLLFPAPVEAATVESFSPQGEVQKVRQVRVRFSAAMVLFGEPSLADPFNITCPEKGKGRWVDGRNWVYDFEKDLPAGVRCRFTLKGTTKTLKGEPMTGKGDFLFHTGGPAIVDITPYEGDESIAEDQMFLIQLNSEVATDTVRKNVSCYIDDTKERVGVRLITGKERDSILRSQYRRLTEKEKDTYVLIQCNRIFPPKARVSIIWGKGITTRSGIATGQDKTIQYKTREAFTGNLRCPRENPRSGCIPVLPMTVRFSAPVPMGHLQKITITGGNKIYKPKVEEKEGDSAYRAVFEGPFPENTRFTVSVPPDMKDDSGRLLANRAKFPVVVKTGPYPPLAKFSSRFGIVEKADPVLPVTVRNIEPIITGRVLQIPDEKGQVTATVDISGADKEKKIVGTTTGRVYHTDSESEIIGLLRKLAATGRKRSILEPEKTAKSFSMPKPLGQKPFEVIGIPLKKAGFYLVELESALLGESLLGTKKPMFVPTGALVTNMAAHFKHGRESSLVWVTSLNDAKPVRGAHVSIRDCTGSILWQGATDSQGIARIGQQLPPKSQAKECKIKRDDDVYYDTDQMKALSTIDSGYFVFVKTADDMTFVHSGWDDGIEPYRFKLPADSYSSPVIAHTVFDRALFRAGDTVHMKHIIRDRTSAGFVLIRDNLPNTCRVEHRGSDEKYEFPIRWNPATGTAENTWTIPKQAKLGTYSVHLFSSDRKKTSSRRSPGQGFTTGSFRVEEFRVPLLKASIKPSRDTLIRTPEVGVDLGVEYLAGGGAGGLAVKLRGIVRHKSVSFDDYDEYIIASGKVKEGLTRRGSEYEREFADDETGLSETRAVQGPKTLETQEITLGTGGTARATIRGIPVSNDIQELLSEMEFRDPNGEIQTVSRRITIWPSQILVGVENDSWASSRDALKYRVVALDTQGKPVSGAKVSSILFGRKSYSHRKRLVGGFYSYEHVTEIKRVAGGCSGTTDRSGTFICETASPVSGNVIIEATAIDRDGNTSVTSTDVWIAGKDEWWFDVADSDRIDLLPEKKKYEPGDTARFQVRMPMREATVLVTIEREGILDAFVKRISGKNALIEVPIKDNYAPNIFVSALCVRGRVNDAKPTALFDPGKPAYKLGITGIQVGWKAHELKVQLTPDRESYRVREKSTVKIRVTTARGKPLPPNSEVAIAAVDEGLLELIPNKSWNILDVMMKNRGYEVENATAQMHIIGKRHYGLKALPRGGGGGKQPTRELFDTLLYWKGTVKLDENGEATVTIPLNDSITGFVIAGVATSGAGLFGTGQTRIRSTQDLSIISGLPPVARHGDRFGARFTLRNTAKGSMNLDVTGTFDDGKTTTSLPAITENLAPGEAKEVSWDITVPRGPHSLTWTVSARDRNSGTTDTVKVTQKIMAPTAVQVVQSTITQIDQTLTMQAARPSGAIEGQGGLRLSFKPKLTDDAGGIITYMLDYPYSCMEQKASKAIALQDESMWNQIMTELPAYFDSDGLLKYFPTMDRGSEVLTAYILSISHEAAWKIPDTLRSRMETGLERFVEGKIFRYLPLKTTDLSLRKLAAIEALTRTKTVKPSLLDSITIEPNLWPTSGVIDWINILKRTQNLRDRARRLREAEQILRSRITFQGTMMSFSTEKGDYLWWLMVNTDLNSIRTILTFLNDPGWKGDLPRLMRGTIGRQIRGKWKTTTANAWGRIALRKFSRAFESKPVTGTSTATFTGKHSLDWQTAKAGKDLTFAWPKAPSTLSVSHTGSGRPWLTVQSLAAVPRTEAFSSGYRITRSVTPVSRKKQGQWSVGDVMRVRIDVDAQSDMMWVVVSDPVPAGATILGGRMARDSLIQILDEKREGWVRPSFEERAFDSFRAYYHFVPKGKFSLEYTIRLNNEGTFRIPETRVEALYAPEMFGEIPNRIVEVKR